jgi:hypothetical protein
MMCWPQLPHTGLNFYPAASRPPTALKGPLTVAEAADQALYDNSAVVAE